MTEAEEVYSIILASKSGDELPLRLSLSGTEYVLLYSPSAGRVERVLVDQFSNNAQAQIDQLNDDLLLKEDKSNKKNTFDVESINFYPSIKAVVDYITGLKGIANGLASIDSEGKIPISQIPDSLKRESITVGGVDYTYLKRTATGTKDVPVQGDVADGGITDEVDEELGNIKVWRSLVYNAGDPADLPSWWVKEKKVLI